MKYIVIITTEAYGADEEWNSESLQAATDYAKELQAEANAGYYGGAKTPVGFSVRVEDQNGWGVWNC